MKLKFNLSFWYSLPLIQTLSQNPYKSMEKRLSVFSEVLWYKCDIPSEIPFLVAPINVLYPPLFSVRLTYTLPTDCI